MMKKRITFMTLTLVFMQPVLYSLSAEPPSPRWRQSPLYTVTATNIPTSVVPPTRNRIALSKLRSESIPHNEVSNTVINTDRSLSEFALKKNSIDTNHIARLNRLYIINAIKRNNALFRIGDQQQACDNLKKLLTETKDPELIKRILTFLGVLNFKLRQFETAASFFSQAMEYAPGNTQIACNLAGAYLSYGELDKAERVLLSIDTNLIQSESLRSAVFFNLACIHSLRGQEDNALNNLAIAAESDPVFTATNIGDTQLDRIRNHKRFARIQRQLRLALNTPRETEEDKISEESTPASESTGNDIFSLQEIPQPVESSNEQLSLPTN